MAQAAAQTMALVTTGPQTASVALGTSLSLPLTNPANSPGQSHDIQTTFLPESFQNMADRIKSRSRKAAIFTQTAHAPSVSQPQHSMAKPQHPSSSPSKTVRESLKRPSPDATGQRPARVRKVSQDKGVENSKTAESTEPIPSQDKVSQKHGRTRKVLQDTDATAPNLTGSMAPTPSQDEVNQRPAQSHVASKNERGTNPSAAEVSAPAPPAARLVPSEEIRPVNDTDAYLAFANKVIKALEIRHQPRPTRFGDRQNRTILKLLQTARPTTREEMLFLTGTEAAQFLAPGIFHNGPILTEGQQPMPLQRIEEFLGEFYDDDSKIFIQDPSVLFSSKHNFVREVTIGAVKKRILGGKSKGRPWNCLELATHVEDGLRPAFLAGEDSRLLTKVKLEHAAAGETASRRAYPQGYKEVEKWALLAESGALTEPHQDSHGYSTYITVNQGNIGFGWLSFPTDEERKAWNKDQSEGATGDRFRYVVMKPGQTVFFPAGTVHFVFRLPSAGHTLAFGGHVLRCSNIVHWIKTLIEEKASPYITNEDLTSSAPGYLNRVEKFVKHAQKNGTVEKWGGAEAVQEFLKLKEAFMAS